MANTIEKKSPIDLLTDLLGEMTARATEAERQRDIAENNARDLYQYHQRKETELKEANERIKELEHDLQEALICIDDLTVKLDKATKTKQGSK